MTKPSADLIAKARAWADNDPDLESRAEIEALLASPDPGATDLADRFAGSLEFGTAGLRGVVGAGPNRMNRAVVIQTTWGLARYLRETLGSAAGGARVVIGYDGRRMSREFAEDTACVLAAAGIASSLFSEVEPTPMLAFAVKHLGCAAGVMVTASHNPPEYNGYKAYWGNGAQIIPPTDVGIAHAIDGAPAAKDVARMPLEEATKKGLVTILGDELEKVYLAEVKKLSVRSDGDRSYTIVYTPMHGVGDKLARLALSQAGFTDVTSVPEQQKPDAKFPTVAFPNPEEKGAMDLSFALARKKNAALVIANDPDADRLAIAIPDETSSTGYMQLTGNQVGVLLGHYLLTQGLTQLDHATIPGKTPLTIASIVSSPMLGVIASELRARYEEVLTGFKWIANRAMDLEKTENAAFVFGYEEALGYTVGDLVRDKDGVSAAVIFAELVAVLRAQGTTVHAHLESLYRRFGLFVSSQFNLTRKGAEGAAELRSIMSRLRQNPPWTIGDHQVVAVRDYLGQVRTTKSGEKTALVLPKSDVLTFELEGGSRVIARPSGTEPKAKFYFDVREAMKPDELLATAEARALDVMKKLGDAFVALAVP
ncbi:Phosphomannomutase [Labilithrix luteola]|uniref:Phosphomannomutase n=1 Tax=Labilithrix luteola TaxID=1391654 RepID=A0A0K1PLU7_9BACT|nr:phospho-sugar mutase [Labilithrix luteola]AKU94366.1 Phosphomannomutase [Labilithrix luteola]